MQGRAGSVARLLKWVLVEYVCGSILNTKNGCQHCHGAMMRALATIGIQVMSALMSVHHYTLYIINTIVQGALVIMVGDR